MSVLYDCLNTFEEYIAVKTEKLKIFTCRIVKDIIPDNIINFESEEWYIENSIIKFGFRCYEKDCDYHVSFLDYDFTSNELDIEKELSFHGFDINIEQKHEIVKNLFKNFYEQKNDIIHSFIKYEKKLEEIKRKDYKIKPYQTVWVGNRDLVKYESDSNYIVETIDAIRTLNENLEKILKEKNKELKKLGDMFKKDIEKKD